MSGWVIVFMVWTAVFILFLDYERKKMKERVGDIERVLRGDLKNEYRRPD